MPGIIALLFEPTDSGGNQNLNIKVKPFKKKWHLAFGPLEDVLLFAYAVLLREMVSTYC
jgi:hypothetical protein